MMGQMNRDASQAKMIAEMASGSAACAHAEIKQVKSPINTIQNDIKDIKSLLKEAPGLSPTSHRQHQSDPRLWRRPS